MSRKLFLGVIWFTVLCRIFAIFFNNKVSFTCVFVYVWSCVWKRLCVFVCVCVCLCVCLCVFVCVFSYLLTCHIFQLLSHHLSTSISRLVLPHLKQGKKFQNKSEKSWLGHWFFVERKLLHSASVNMFIFCCITKTYLGKNST